jgi:hypothetical protein
VLTWAIAFTRDTRRERAFTTSMIDEADDVYSNGPDTTAA